MSLVVIPAQRGQEFHSLNQGSFIPMVLGVRRVGVPCGITLRRCGWNNENLHVIKLSGGLSKSNVQCFSVILDFTSLTLCQHGMQYFRHQQKIISFVPPQGYTLLLTKIPINCTHVVFMWCYTTLPRSMFTHLQFSNSEQAFAHMYLPSRKSSSERQRYPRLHNLRVVWRMSPRIAPSFPPVDPPEPRTQFIRELGDALCWKHTTHNENHRTQVYLQQNPSPN